MDERQIARLTSPAEAERWCRAVVARGETLGFVPTMGALHEGHLALVERALRENDVACVSIFVNPLQFDDPRDLERYPRNWEADCTLLDSVGCSMAFTGGLRDFFPGSIDDDGVLDPALRVDPGAGALGLEGDSRTGHFDGVATIVQRLFEIVEPTRAYFGQKDFQQTLVVRGLAERRGGPEVVVAETVRSEDGLALSSRNALLAPADRAEALAIARALQAAQVAWDAGERDAAALANAMQSVLAASRLDPIYVEVRDPRAWTAERPEGDLEHAVALVAASIADVRLIDNRVLCP